MPAKKQLHSVVEIGVKQLIKDSLSSGACKEPVTFIYCPLVSVKKVTFVNHKAAHTGSNIAIPPQHPAR